MESRESIFRDRVYNIVSLVPKGKVVTYGQVALLAGIPRAAREVGWIAHAGPSHLPWQRVLNRFGGLAEGYHGGQHGHRVDLEKDRVIVRDDLTVDLAQYQWWPEAKMLRELELPAELAEELNKKIPLSRERLTPKYRRN